MGKYNHLYWSDEEYLKALEIQRKRIADGLKPEFHDDDTIGNKSTACSWGCKPDSLPKGFSRKLYRAMEQRCPLDTRPTKLLDGNGCFWTCMAFQSKYKRPPRGVVLELYDFAIREVRERLEKNTRSITEPPRSP